MDIKLVTHCDHNGRDFGQWYLIADGCNIGFVIKHNWHIHITQQVADDIRDAVMQRLQQMKEGEHVTEGTATVENEPSIQDDRDRWRGILVAELDGSGEGKSGPVADGPADSEGELPETA